MYTNKSKSFNVKYLFLSISLLCKLIINLFVVFYIAKKVSLNEFGSFSLAFIISSILIIILDYGFNLKALILSQKNNNQINFELSSMTFAKILLAGLVILGLSIFILFNNYDDKTNFLLIILGFSAIPASFGNFFLNNYKIINRFDKEAIGNLIQIGILFILLLFNNLFGSNDIVYYSILILIARIGYFIYAFFSFKKGHFSFFSFNLKHSWSIIRISTPFAVHLILGASIIYIDTFILSFLSTLENVGLYQAGMRIIMASLLIAVIINDAFIPSISRLALNKILVTAKLNKLFQFILLFSLLTIFTIYFYRVTIILLLFSKKYLALESNFLYIISIILLRYIGIVPGIILTCFGKQIVRARAVLTSIIFSVILNFILIPLLGIQGAFLSSLIAHIVLNLIYVYYSLGIIKFTKHIPYFYLIFVCAIQMILQNLVFIDSLNYLISTLFINIVLLVLYFVITPKQIKKLNFNILNK